MDALGQKHAEPACGAGSGRSTSATTGETRPDHVAGGTGQLIALLVLFGLLACSHDAKQESPLDPELTPTVPLVVALDDTAGTALLSWTP